MDSPREEGDDDEGAAADVDDTPRSARSERRRRSPREDSEDSRHAAVHSEMKRQLSTKKIHNVHQLRQRLRSLSYDNGGQNPAKLFQQFDVDSSGALDYAEFTAAVRKGGKVTRQWMSDLELKQLFETVDTSGDKEITIDELTAFVWGADAVPASLRSPSGAAGSPRGRRGRKSAADSGPEIQEALYDEFEKTLVADDEPGAGASAQLSESPPSSSRRGRGGGEGAERLGRGGQQRGRGDDGCVRARHRWRQRTKVPQCLKPTLPGQPGAQTAQPERREAAGAALLRSVAAVLPPGRGLRGQHGNAERAIEASIAQSDAQVRRRVRLSLEADVEGEHDAPRRCGQGHGLPPPLSRSG